MDGCSSYASQTVACVRIAALFTQHVIVRQRCQRLALAVLCACVTIGVIGQRVLAQSAPLTPFARQKAESLLRDKLSCMGCHRIGGSGGIIGPGLDDVRTRRDPAYIAAIIRDPARARPGAAMPQERLPEGERVLIIRYFGGDPAAAPPPTTPIIKVDTAVVAVYARWCAGCHGATGKGDGPNAKQLPVAPARHADAATMRTRSDDALYDTIHGGGAIMNRSARMPAFGASLSPVKIRGLVRYIRSLCACEGPAWSR